MPPLGPKEGEKTEVREGEDSVWRNECGVGGTSSVMLLENDLSNPGVRMVKFAGLRRIPFKGTCTGDGGAERWCEVPSTIDAVAIGGRDWDGGGILSERFLRFRARLPGESGRGRLAPSEAGWERLLVDEDWLSKFRAGGMVNLLLNANGMDEGDSGEELGDVSATDGESNVEMVVVGEESAEPDVTEEILARCWKGKGRRVEVLMVTLVGRRRGLSAVFRASFSGKSSVRPPKTDMKEGNESGSVGALVCTGMVVSELGEIHLRLKGIVALSGSQL